MSGQAGPSQARTRPHPRGSIWKGAGPLLEGLTYAKIISLQERGLVNEVKLTRGRKHKEKKAYVGTGGWHREKKIKAYREAFAHVDIEVPSSR